MSEEKIKIEMDSKYVPLMESLKKEWDCKDLNDVLKHSVLLMTYLTDLSLDGKTIYIQESPGNYKEMSILSKNDISRDIENIKKTSFDSLKNLI
jgi:hypothetical protein